MTLDLDLAQLLNARSWLLADAGMATQLRSAGLPAGAAPEPWMGAHPDAVRAVHRAAVAAGSDIILTNSFGANGARLARSGSAGQPDEINRLAVVLARDAAGAADRPVLVAGAMGPTGEIMAPMGTLSHDAAVATFLEQALALADAGADLLWLETLSSTEELRAAAEAIARTGLPWIGTMSFGTGGRTLMGVTPAEMARLVETLPVPPLAFGANCGTGPSDLVRSILDFTAAGTERPIVAKPSAGLPTERGGRLHYGVTPAAMADFAQLARDAGARVLGGCCGTTADHLSAMRAALDARPAGPRPTPEAVAATLGPFSAPGDDDDDGAPTLSR